MRRPDVGRRLVVMVLVLAGAGWSFLSAAAAEPAAARRLSAIQVIVEERGLVVSLAGDGVLTPSSIHEAEHWPPRLVVDLPDVASWVPGITPVGAGPVEDIRVLAHSLDPLVTRVVFELRRATTYEIAEVDDANGRTLTLVFPLAPTQDERSESGQNGLDQNARVTSSNERPPPRVRLARAVLPPVPGRFAPGWAGRRRAVRTVAPSAPPVLLVAQALSFERVHAPPTVDPRWRPIGREPRVVRSTNVALGYLVTPLTAPASGDFSRVQSSARVRPSSSRVGTRTTQMQQITQGAPRQYTGDPVSMDFQSADLRAVLRTFAEISGLNVVIDPQVNGTVDVALTDVPWDQALDVILRANQLGYVVDGTVVRIAPLAVLADEETQRRTLAEEQALAGELVVLTRTLSYSRAEAMAELITQSVLSARGQVHTDERTNTLVIRDLQARLRAAEDLLDTLDRAEPQVEIEARIVQAGQDFARSIGVQWGLTGRVAPDLGNTTPLTFPNRGGISGRVGTQGAEASGADARAVATENVGTAVNLPAAAASSAVGVTLGAVDGSLNLDVVLSAAEGDGQIRLLSHPRVTTQNNVAAEIVQGDQIPIQTVSNNTVTVRFEDAALSLRVTPQITAEDTVIMQIEIDNDFADFGREINGVPPIVTQRASTTVQVANGDTTVIGGIFESERSSSNDRVPALHRIPLLGWLFRSSAERESTDELLIFLTPKIVR